MAPGLDVLVRRIAPVEKPTDPDALILESWAQGYMVGSLIIMAAVTIANMRRGVLLHKLILLEVGLRKALRVLFLKNIHHAPSMTISR